MFRPYLTRFPLAVIRDQPELKFRVVQNPDHKLRIREMWARTQIAFPAFFDEIQIERNLGSVRSFL
jgi:hypothetical protein